MIDDVIFRLSPGGGPPPLDEILFHAQRAQEYGRTWVGLPRGRQRNVAIGKSSVYLISSHVSATKTVLRGVVRQVTSRRPDDELIGDLYQGHVFAYWWCLASVHCVTVDFDSLGLTMRTNGLAYDTEWLSKRQPVNYLIPSDNWPDAALPAADSCDAENGPSTNEELCAAPFACEEPDVLAPAVAVATGARTPPRVPIHAVDWSGAGANNWPTAKIRCARWECTTTGSVVHVHGMALARRDVLEMIRTRPGLWILDFPFGLPLELMRRANVAPDDVAATWGFTGACAKNNFRDHCNAIWNAGPRAGNKHRVTETTVGGGWFAWFIQLFRQTWTGQVEILTALRAADDPVAILPFDETASAATMVLEGFPRATLRRNGLPFRGYKTDSPAGQHTRQTILSGLIALGLPLTQAVVNEAVADAEGDLVDALALLVAGRDALNADHADIRRTLRQQRALGEGWIYP